MAGINSSTLITQITEKITLNGNKYNNVVEKKNKRNIRYI